MMSIVSTRWRGIDLSELEPQSFIIKIWLEETAEEASEATWRGHITHVPSRKRSYLQDLDKIALFIVPYLREMGIEFQMQCRVQTWAGWLRNHLSLSRQDSS
jgi:hypothetical protein